MINVEEDSELEYIIIQLVKDCGGLISIPRGWVPKAERDTLSIEVDVQCDCYDLRVDQYVKRSQEDIESLRVSGISYSKIKNKMTEAQIDSILKVLNE